MPDYHKVIAVSGNDFVPMMSLFSDLVRDKFHKPVPYRDFTRLRKYNKEVEFRFADDGAVMIVPTEPGVSLLYWTKKGDNSLGDFLWDYFKEELEEMHPNENTKIINNNTSEDKYKYDLWGEYNEAAINRSTSALEAITVADKSSTSYAYATSTPTYSTAISGVSEMSETIEQLKARVEELGKLVKDSSAHLHGAVQEVARTSTKSVEEVYGYLESELTKRPTINEMEYCIEDRIMDVCSEIDDVHYETKCIGDRVRELEDNGKETTVAMDYCDADGILHEIPVTKQGSSSSYYPVKNYTLKADVCASDNRKEKESMDMNKMFNGFEFGPVDDRIKMSPYGMAVRNAEGRYVSYDTKTGNIVDVEVFNFENRKLIWKMPVAVSAVAVGDTIVHMKKPMFVTSVTNGITAIDIFAGEVKTIMPATNMFNFNFVTKVVSLFNFSGANAPTAENPFGNILPFMLMSEGGDFKDMLPLMLMTNGTNGLGNFAQNPLMLYALMKDSDGIDDVLPFLMMGQNGLFGQAPAHTCNCGGQCNGENHQ